MLAMLMLHNDSKFQLINFAHLLHIFLLTVPFNIWYLLLREIFHCLINPLNVVTIYFVVFQQCPGS